MEWRRTHDLATPRGRVSKSKSGYLYTATSDGTIIRAFLMQRDFQKLLLTTTLIFLFFLHSTRAQLPSGLFTQSSVLRLSLLNLSPLINNELMLLL